MITYLILAIGTGLTAYLSLEALLCFAELDAWRKSIANYKRRLVMARKRIDLILGVRP